MFSSLTGAFVDKIGPGKDFLSIETTFVSAADDGRIGQNTIKFVQAPPLQPPVAALKTYTATISTANSYNFSPFEYAFNPSVAADLYSYPLSGYALSASGRISTDPNGDNITVI